MSDASLNTQQYEGEAGFGDYFALLKPRVMSLVVFTALVGLLAAPVGVHPMIAFASILFIAIGAGASGALNMWWDADIDQIMRRTKGRPIPAGKVDAQDALHIGLALSGMSVVMLGSVAGASGNRDVGAGREPAGRVSAGLHDFLLCRDLFDVAEAVDAAEHRYWRCCRGVSAGHRLGGRDRQHEL